jgi:integrase
LVFVRPGELRGAKWSDVDLDAAEWRYTPPKTRNQTKVDLIVPLSRQAVEILRAIRTFTKQDVYVFPSQQGRGRPLSENTVNKALRRLGYTSEQMCGHGFRAVARTILEEGLGYRAEIIDMQLGHAVPDTHGRAYNRTKFLSDRTKMMQRWADYLDGLKAGADVLAFKKHA